MHRCTIREVPEDYLDLAQRGDVETDIARNFDFDPDRVLMTSYGTLLEYARRRHCWRDRLARQATIIKTGLGPQRSHSRNDHLLQRSE